jgi:hypothetical protein
LCHDCVRGIERLKTIPVNSILHHVLDVDKGQLPLQKSSPNTSHSVASLVLIVSVSRHSSSGLLLMHSLLMIDPVLAAVILDLMERRGNSMKETADDISTTIDVDRSTRCDLRADNRQNERAPRKIAGVIIRIGRRTRHIVRTAVA